MIIRSGDSSSTSLKCSDWLGAEVRSQVNELGAQPIRGRAPSATFVQESDGLSTSSPVFFRLKIPSQALILKDIDFTSNFRVSVLNDLKIYLYLLGNDCMTVHNICYYLRLEIFLCPYYSVHSTLLLAARSDVGCTTTLHYIARTT